MCHNITCFKMIDFISAKLPHCCGYLLMIQVCTVARDWKYFLLFLDWLTHSIKRAGTHLYTYLENCFKCQTFFYTDPGQGFDSSELLKVQICNFFPMFQVRSDWFVYMVLSSLPWVRFLSIYITAMLLNQHFIFLQTFYFQLTVP